MPFVSTVSTKSGWHSAYHCDRISVTVGSLANQMQLTSLLLRCKEITRKFNAQLMFVEKNNGEQSAYGNICRTVKVPLYTIGLEESSETDLYDQRAEFKGVT